MTASSGDSEQNLSYFISVRHPVQRGPQAPSHQLRMAIHPAEIRNHDRWDEVSKVSLSA